MTPAERARRSLATVGAGATGGVLAGFLSANVPLAIISLLIMVFALAGLFDARLTRARNQEIQERLRPARLRARIQELERDTAVPVAQLIRDTEDKVVAAGEFTGDAVVMWDGWPGPQQPATQEPGRAADLIAADLIRGALIRSALDLADREAVSLSENLDGATVHKSGRRLGKLVRGENTFRFVRCGSAELPHTRPDGLRRCLGCGEALLLKDC